MHPDPDGFYARLGLAPTASAEAIAAAYRRAALVLHPDIPGTGSTAAFLALRAAYEVLGDPARRRAYDGAGDPAARFAPAGRGAQRRPDQPADLPGDFGADGFGPPDYGPGDLGLGRPPRRFAIWAGFLIGSAVLAAWLMLRIAEGPTSGLPDGTGPVPTWTAPPALPRARPVGTANHFVLPGLGALTVLRQNRPGLPLVPVARLAPFTPVEVLGTDPNSRLAAIRLAGSSIGFVAADRLTHGDAAAAHGAFCADRAGPQPVSGAILSARGRGPARITLVNGDLEPAVVKLRDGAGRLVRAVFLAPGARVTLRDLPGRAWETEFAVGELWSRPCRYFAAGERALRFPFALGWGSVVVLPPNLPGRARPVDIPDRRFARP